MRGTRWLFAGIAVVLALAVIPRHAAAEDQAGCAIINCDCANLKAGILTGSWRKDCQTCETRLRETCSQNSPPLINGLRKAGTCERKCSVYGENAYPKAPPATASAPRSPDAPPVTFGVGEGAELLSCPPKMRLATQTIDGMQFTGCIGGNGRRTGLWLFVDKERKKVMEIVYVDGKETSRKEHAL